MGKRCKSILSILLICGLLVVSVPCRVDAVGPVALAPAVKYAIAAGIVAGGLYATDTEALTYAINDYWTKASDHVKQQWSNAVIYGTGIGSIIINDPLRKTVNDYLEENYGSGINYKSDYGDQLPVIEGEYYYKDQFWINGYSPTTRFEYGYTSRGTPDYRWYLEIDGVQIFYLYAYGSNAHEHTENWVKLWVEGDRLYYELSRWSNNNPDIRNNGNRKLSDIAALLGVSNVVLTGAESFTYEFVGDSVGFGKAKPDDDIKIPCPPVPAAEWPDTWLDNLLDDMNRTGNPTLDDETFVEECEREWDWYWDDNVAYIYRVPKGDPPRDPDDEPYRIPIPPPPQPEIPYPQPDPIKQPAEPCPYCPPNPYPSPDGEPCPNPYCPNQPNPVPVPVPQPATPAEPCPYCPPNPYPSPNGEPCPNPYCPNQPNQQPVPKPPPDIQPYYDDPEINWEPLRRTLYELTEKFPFCLPWDLMRGIQTLESNQWDRQIRINVGDGIWPEMVIDLKMFDKIAGITRVVLLVVFDLGLIFGTRRLMGGDV